MFHSSTYPPIPNPTSKIRLNPATAIEPTLVQTSAQLTLSEFLQLPETKPASEFIDGQIIQKPMPQGKHSTLQSDLGAAINACLKPQHIARAYSELRCTFGNRSIVPDLSIFTWERIPRDHSLG